MDLMDNFSNDEQFNYSHLHAIDAHSAHKLKLKSVLKMPSDSLIPSDRIVEIAEHDSPAAPADLLVLSSTGSPSPDSPEDSDPAVCCHHKESVIDTSGYASNNSSKDDQDMDPVSNMIGSSDGGHSCSCSVSVRSSSPESVLSVQSGSTGSHAGAWSLVHIDDIDGLGGVRSEDDGRTGGQQSMPTPTLRRFQRELLRVNDNGDSCDLSRQTEQSNETPIEREIRQAREREDEMRREKGWTMPDKSQLKPFESRQRQKRNDLLLQKTETIFDEAAANTKLHHTQYMERLTASRTTSSSSTSEIDGDTQRRLATIRLQQEIEQQKRRELDLRRDGRVKSISDEHADVADLLSAGTASVGETDASPTPGSLESFCSTPEFDGNLPRGNIMKHKAFFEQNLKKIDNASAQPPVLRFKNEDNHVNQENERNNYVNGEKEVKYVKNEAKVPENYNRFARPTGRKERPVSMILPSNSSPSDDSGLASNPASPTCVSDAEFHSLDSQKRHQQQLRMLQKGGTISNMKVPMSIERLISGARGKGRERMFNGDSNGDFGGQGDAYVDYSVVRTKANVEPAIKKVVYKTTERKISDEMREMEEREQELRRVRTNLGLSVIESAEEQSTPVRNVQVIKNELTHHATTVSDSPVTGGSSEECVRDKPRRRTALVAQWEERIQQQV